MIYVIGGHGHGQALATIEGFDTRIGLWQEVTPMPTPRLGCIAIAAAGRIYVFCGHDGNQALRAAECFDPQTGSWKQLPAVPTPRYACAGVTVFS